MVTDEERDYMWSEYAQDPRMKANIGIRRRLAPLLDNDLNRIELFTALLLSLPGSPVLYYGDEIGMGDNIWLGDRDGVRTPMQWTPDRNAGFSNCDPGRLYLPVNSDSIYGYQVTNVESQTRNTSSLLHWTRRMIGLRKANPAFGLGTFTDLGGSNPLGAVLRPVVRRRRGAVREQPVPVPAGGRAGPAALGGRRADRDDRRQPVPGDRRAALPAHRGRTRLLLAAHSGPPAARRHRAAGQRAAPSTTPRWRDCRARASSQRRTGRSATMSRLRPTKEARCEGIRTEMSRVLRDWLGQQRWFAGKSRTSTVHRPAAGHAGRQAVPGADLAGRRPATPRAVEHYQVPLVLRTEPVDQLATPSSARSPDADGGPPIELYDALHDKEVTGLWLAGDRRAAHRRRGQLRPDGRGRRDPGDRARAWR